MLRAKWPCVTTMMSSSGPYISPSMSSTLWARPSIPSSVSASSVGNFQCLLFLYLLTASWTVIPVYLPQSLSLSSLMATMGICSLAAIISAESRARRKSLVTMAL